MTQNKQNLISLIAILLFVFGWISVNIYLPALPFLSHDFHTNQQDLKFSITLFLIGFALAQLIWGPISEKYGRKPPLIYGLVITIIGITLTMLAPDITVFNSGRFIEAIGLGCAPVLGRAILIDALDPIAFSSTMAYGTISANIMPAIAPIIGGHILIWFGWRYIFTFLLIYGFILLGLLIFSLPETHQNLQRHINIFQTFKHYSEAFTHKKFLGYLTPYIVVTGAMIGYYTVTPFIFISKLNLSPNNYGYLSIITVGTYILGAIVSRFISPKYGVKKMVILGILILLFAACIFFLSAIFSSLNIFSIIIPMSIYTFAAGIICPNSNAGAMNALRHKAGVAAAVIGFSLYLSSSILSTIITAVSIENLWPLAIYIGIVALIGFLVFYLLVIRAKNQVKQVE